MRKLVTAGSKKAVEPEVVNGEILLSTTKRTNFDQVSAGVCPHDNSKLEVSQRAKLTILDEI